jgi:hypothetical protein
MANLPLENPEAMDAVYGRCDHGHGREDPAWYAANIVKLIPPYPMVFSWKDASGRRPAVKALNVHRLIHDPLMETLLGIQKLLGSLADIQHYCMDRTGGAQMFRPMRGSATQLSIHSWGAAIDMDPEHNPFPHVWVDGKGMVRKDVVAIFEKNGAHWRGHNGDNDPMHFQWARHRDAY